jgi:hypothetical protein
MKFAFIQNSRIKYNVINKEAGNVPGKKHDNMCCIIQENRKVTSIIYLFN